MIRIATIGSGAIATLFAEAVARTAGILDAELPHVRALLVGAAAELPDPTASAARAESERLAGIERAWRTERALLARAAALRSVMSGR